MMAIGKWSMYLSAVLFFVIGFGALAVALVPGADEWFAEEILETGGVDASEGLIDLVADSEGVQTTSWILAATFIPTGLLFVYAGRWFKSMEGGMSSMMGASLRTMQATTAMYQPNSPGVVTGSGVAAGAPPSPPPPPRTAPPDPVVEPPDPTAGGIIT